MANDLWGTASTAQVAILGNYRSSSWYLERKK